SPHVITTIFFFTSTPTPPISTLSLHDALPIFLPGSRGPRRLDRGDHHGIAGRRRRSGRPRSAKGARGAGPVPPGALQRRGAPDSDRKSTRLNSSHDQISYAVFCLKKKKNKNSN